MKSYVLALGMVMAVGSASADEVDKASRPVGECDVKQVIPIAKKSPTGVTASGYCETGGGGLKSCSVQVGAASGYELDTAQNVNPVYQCRALSGDNPCAFVTTSPVMFQSEQVATREFKTNSDRVGLTQTLAQLKVEYSDSEEQTAHLRLVTGGAFSILVAKSAKSARLECDLKNGDHLIFRVSDKDLGNLAAFTSVDANDSSYTIYNYRVK